MPRELKNVNITHVSYVDKAANKKKFFLTKSEKQPNFEKQVRVLVNKEDSAEKLVYGVVYEPDSIDAHEDFMTAEEIEKAAHTFMKDYRNLDKQHDFVPGAGEVVESYVAPDDFTVGGETIKKGSWVLVTKATDEVWEAIQKGEITGYSMAGTAEAIEVEKQEDEHVSFFKAMKNFFTKGEVQDKYYAQKPGRDLREALWTFEDVFFDELWKTSPDVQKMAEAAHDLGELLVQIGQEHTILKQLIEEKDELKIQKAGKKISSARYNKIRQAYDALTEIVDEIESENNDDGEETEVKKEELQEILKEAIQPVTERLDKLEKAQEEVEKEEVKKEEAITAEDITAAVQKALEPIEERLETVEKSRGIGQADNENGEEAEVKKSAGSIWDGVL